MLLAEQLGDYYIPSVGNGELDENVPAFDISDEEAEDCQKINEEISA